MGSISFPTPSFEIRGASGAPSTPRWDRIDSRSLIAQARRVYFAYLSSSPAGLLEPIGVVVDTQDPDGRVVFETPVLLPDEEFIAIDLIRGRTSRGRTRWKG